MSEHHRFLADNPSLETQVALVVQALDTFMEHDREWKRETGETLGSLDKKVGIQNGNVARLTERANRHDEWHGASDVKLATRVGTLWDDRSAALIRKGVYLTWGRVAMFAIGVAGSFGVGGLLIGRFA